MFARAPLANEIFELVCSDSTPLAAFLLPDHLHWVRSDSEELATAMRRFKSLSTHLAWSLGVGGKLWQRSHWDRVIRSQQDLVRTVAYIQAQPVRHGLCGDAADYPYLFERSHPVVSDWEGW